MNLASLFKKLKREPKFASSRDFEQEKLYALILESQAQSIKEILDENLSLNGITSKKLYDYWTNYKFICFSNDNFTITIDGKEYSEYRFTPAELADFTLQELPKHDIIGTAAALSSALDAVCLKYSELVDLCGYLQENNLRVRKA